MQKCGTVRQKREREREREREKERGERKKRGRGEKSRERRARAKMPDARRRVEGASGVSLVENASASVEPSEYSRTRKAAMP